VEMMMLVVHVNSSLHRKHVS